MHKLEADNDVVSEHAIFFRKHRLVNHFDHIKFQLEFSFKMEKNQGKVRILMNTKKKKLSLVLKINSMTLDSLVLRL